MTTAPPLRVPRAPAAALFLAEGRRLLARRATWLIAVATGGVIVLIAAVAAASLPPRTQLGQVDYLAGFLTFGALVIALFGSILGATYWGADFRHGTLGTLLTFVPSRSRVWLARTAVVLLAGLVFGVVLLGLLMLLLAVFTGGVLFAGEAPLAPDLASMVGREVLLVAGATLLGSFLAIILHNTGAAVLVPVAYLFVRGLLSVTGIQVAAPLQRVLPETYLQALLTGKATLVFPGGGAPGRGDVTFVTVTAGEAILAMTVVLAALGVLSWWLLQRRSITD